MAELPEGTGWPTGHGGGRRHKHTYRKPNTRNRTGSRARTGFLDSPVTSKRNGEPHHLQNSSVHHISEHQNVGQNRDRLPMPTPRILPMPLRHLRSPPTTDHLVTNPYKCSERNNHSSSRWKPHPTPRLYNPLPCSMPKGPDTMATLD